METIGEKIRNLRKVKNLSQEDFALELGLSRQTVAKWEADKVNPNAENITSLCKVFGVSADYFLINESIIDDINEATKTKDETIEKSDKAGEVAVSSVLECLLPTTTEKELHSNSKGAKIGLIISSVLVGILLLLSLIITIIIANAVFSPNTGDIVIANDNIEIHYFVIALILLIIFFVAEIIICAYIFKKNRNVNKR